MESNKINIYGMRLSELEQIFASGVISSIGNASEDFKKGNDFVWGMCEKIKKFPS